jgi:PHD/YefM family antitoxin component YafN of YafNO toxin-antitoxin module
MQTHTGVVADVPAVPATDVKNAMAEVMDLTTAQGMVALTKHGKVRAVMLSVPTYETLVKRAGDPLEKLSRHFDRMLASMQGVKARKAADAVFGRLPSKAQSRRRSAR